MKNKITVRRYQKSDFTQWNSFINEAKNSTFLFHRDFMEYHSDRFEDFSLFEYLSPFLNSYIRHKNIKKHMMTYLKPSRKIALLQTHTCGG
jgi:hypothetical protein